jgi:membrane protease YdiL (CAAX protease family)
MDGLGQQSGWKNFWNRGGWWRAVIAAVGYIAIYLGASKLIELIFKDQLDGQLFSSPLTLFLSITLPVIVGSAVLLAFIWSVGWLKPLFARQPVRGRWWMWIAPLLVAAAIVLRLLGIDYAAYPASVVIIMFLSGPFIGFAEEVLTRGIVVKMLRDSGKNEWVVMALSSLVFGLLHATNIFSGQPLYLVAATIGFTFGFGVCMYLVLRVTGNLIWPIVLHALYDPSLFLATGGIDESNVTDPSPLIVAAEPANAIFVVVALIALILVRGRAQRPVEAPTQTDPAIRTA